MNAPDCTSPFLLDEDIGEVKIVYTADTKASTNSTVIFKFEVARRIPFLIIRPLFSPNNNR